MKEKKIGIEMRGENKFLPKIQHNNFIFEINLLPMNQ